MEKISIIVPVYNVEKCIHRCIDSILEQTYQNFELLLVDDGSPDRCGEICEDYAKKDARIKVFHQKNKGLSVARNVAIDYVFQKSNSEWITFIDSDDWVHSRYLQILYETVVESKANIGVVGYINSNDETPEVDQTNGGSVVLKVEDFWMHHRTNATIACGKLYRKSCFENIRYPAGRIYEDEYTTYKILFAEPQIVFNSIPLYFYFVNPKGITQSKWSLKSLDSLDALKGQADYFKRNKFIRAYKSSARLYLEKLNYNSKQLKNNGQHYKLQKKQIENRLKRDIWKYGLACNYVPVDRKCYLYSSILQIKEGIINPLLKKKRNLMEIIRKE